MRSSHVPMLALGGSRASNPIMVAPATPGTVALPSETEIMQWGPVLLTNCRVRYESTTSGNHSYVSLALDRVDWVGLTREHKPGILVLAAVVAMGALYFGMGHDQLVITAIGIVIALLILLMYFASRTVVLAIGGGQGRISVTIKGGDQERATAKRFLDRVQEHSLRARRRM